MHRNFKDKYIIIASPYSSKSANIFCKNLVPLVLCAIRYYVETEVYTVKALPEDMSNRCTKHINIDKGKI